MDSITAVIVAALSAAATGALTETSKTTLMNAYNALKAAIQKRFGSEHVLVKAVEAVEIKPSSEGRQKTLVEEVIEVGADRDRELLALAEHIRQLLGERPKENITVTQNIYGEGNVTSVYGDATVTIKDV